MHVFVDAKGADTLAYTLYVRVSAASVEGWHCQRTDTVSWQY